MIEGLEPFSRRFAERLFARFPEWCAYATVDGPEGWLPGALGLEVPTPRPDRRVLFIDTEGDDLTISFDRWHTHLDSGPEAEALASAVDLVAALVGEKLLVAVRTRDGAWTGSCLVESGECLSDPRPGEQVQILSWTGALDRTLPSAAATVAAAPA